MFSFLFFGVGWLFGLLVGSKAHESSPNENSTGVTFGLDMWGDDR